MSNVMIRAFALGLMAAVSAFPTAAFAQATTEVTPVLKLGEKISGEVEDGTPITFVFQGYPNTSLKLLVAAAKRSQALPTVSMAAPNGTAVALDANTFSNAKGTKVVIKGLTLGQSGLYQVTVGTQSGTAGGVSVKLNGRYPTKVSTKTPISVPGGSQVLRFNAAEDDRVVVSMKVPKSSELEPDLTLTEASGEQFDILQDQGKIKLSVDSAGEHELKITGANGSSGHYVARVKVRVNRKRRRQLFLPGFSLQRDGDNRLPFCVRPVSVVTVPFRDNPTFRWQGNAIKCVDLDGTIVGYRWDFSGGRPSFFTDLTPSIELARNDIMSVDLTLTDNDGGETAFAFNVIGDQVDGGGRHGIGHLFGAWLQSTGPIVGIDDYLVFNADSSIHQVVSFSDGTCFESQLVPEGSKLAKIFEIKNGRLRFRTPMSVEFERVPSSSLPSGCDLVPL